MSEGALKLLVAAIIAIGVIGFSFFALSRTKDNTEELDEKYDNKTEEIFGTMNYQTPQERLSDMGIHVNA